MRNTVDLKGIVHQAERRQVMRRKDKAVTALADIEAIINASAYFTLGMAANDEAYMAPLDFGYEPDGEHLGAIYFHCARTGRKLDLIRQNPKVSLLFVAAGHAMIDEGDGSLACTLNTNYRSVMALGEARIIDQDQEAEKLAAMRVLLKQHGCEELPVSPENLAKTALVRIALTSATGKAYQP